MGRSPAIHPRAIQTIKPLGGSDQNRTGSPTTLHPKVNRSKHMIEGNKRRMGNAASDAAEDAAMTRVETLRDQLADMERAVRHLSGVPQQIDELLPHQVRVHHQVVSCNPDVRVLLGPVIGKVDGHSARVLLEVDRATQVTCHVLIFDARTQAFTEVRQNSVCIRETPARRPVVFLIQALVPGRQYRVVFSGIRRDDALLKTGSFSTPSASGDLLWAIVSADDVYDLEYGEHSLWSELRRAVVDEQRVQLVLHLGGQVAMKRMFDKAWTLLVRHAECAAPPVTTTVTTSTTASSSHSGSGGDAPSFSQAWKILENEAMEILRSAYRTQWAMLEDKACVLANASNLMMWSDWDVYPAFTTSALFHVDHCQPTLEMQVLRTVVRCARRLFLEYQRALWDDSIDQVFPREAELHAIAEQALATTARIHQLSNQIPIAQNDLESQKKRRDIDGARKAERHVRALEAEKTTTEKTLVSYNQLLAPQSGEEFVYQLGGTAFMVLDMRSARVEPGGSQRAESEVLSNVQWAFIERVLEDESIQLLHVCTEVPLVDDLPHELRLAVDADSSECDFKTWWGSNAHAQQRLLGLLFEWKLQQEGREVVLLAGSCNTRFSMKTIVRDTRLRTEITQWMTGPLSAVPSGRAIPSRAGLLFDRYAFEHDDAEAVDKSFLSLDVVAMMRTSSSSTTVANAAAAAAGTTTKSSQIKRVDGSVVQDPPRVLLGPIVGHVDAISAVVLLEVDRSSDVVCAVTNPLTGERLRVFQHFEPRRPNSFFLNHLRSEHHYEIRFERIQDAERYSGGFTTLAKMPHQFQLVAMSHCVSGSAPQPSQTKSLWPWINGNLNNAIPFRGVDKTIHFESGKMESGEVSLLKHLASENGTSQELLLAKLRDGQRLRWKMPGSRQLFHRGSHVFLTEQTVMTHVEHGDSRQLILQQCVDQIQLEYENLLLPPSKRVEHWHQRLQNPIRFACGAFGVFVLPAALTRTDLDDNPLWTCLSDFLRTPCLSGVAIVASKAIVEDGVEDAEEKARFDSSASDTLAFQRHKLQRLLEILTTWHQQTPPRVDGSTPAPHQSRSIVFICGHETRSFDTIIQDLSISPSSPIPRPLRIQQFVVGPLLPSSTLRQSDLQLGVFPQGTLFGKFGYFHRFYSTSITADEATSGAAGNDATVDTASSSRALGHEPRSQQQLLSQLFHLQMTIQPTVDDVKHVQFAPTFVVSDAVTTSQSSNAAVLEARESVAHVQCVDVVARSSSENKPQWVITTRQPAWLVHVVSQQLSDQEETTARELQTVLRNEKAADVELSFQRSRALATGIVAVEARMSVVAHLQAAFQDFHCHIAGMAFRTKYPAIPSAYVVNYTLDELTRVPVPQPEVEQDGSGADARGGTGADPIPVAITGAIELEQYRAVLLKSFQNATLFDSRLRAFWS